MSMSALGSEQARWGAGRTGHPGAQAHDGAAGDAAGEGRAMMRMRPDMMPPGMHVQDLATEAHDVVAYTQIHCACSFRCRRPRLVCSLLPLRRTCSSTRGSTRSSFGGKLGWACL
jgi:hypothetical protein